MTKRFIILLVLVFSCIPKVLCQDSTFLLMGPSVGVNRSWRTYDRAATPFQTTPLPGFEAGLNFFYKSKASLGLMADLSFLETRSSITAFDIGSEAQVKETSKWLTAGANIIFFPLRKTKTLPFFGTGLSVAFLDRSNASVKVQTVPPDESFSAEIDLDQFRTNRNYFFKIVGGLTINKFDKHRILFLATYSKSLARIAEQTDYYPPFYISDDYCINGIAFKVIMAL